MLHGPVNLVEIDLLRQGAHTVSAPAAELARLGSAHYVVCTRRTARLGGYEVVRFTVRDPLPLVGIPLREEDSDVVLHLPQVFTRSYDVGAYAYRVDYTREPDPPLSPEDTEWAKELLKKRGVNEGGGS